jgi:hypothetical protein
MPWAESRGELAESVEPGLRHPIGRAKQSLTSTVLNKELAQHLAEGPPSWADRPASVGTPALIERASTE